MTIAIGIKFEYGVLLCADTKITTHVKTNQSKLITHVYGDGDTCATAFAFAGDVDFARAAIRDCKYQIERNLSVLSSSTTVRELIETVLRTFYESHMYARPEWKDRDFSLLVAVWLNGGDTVLFSSNETVLNEVDDYECLGIGDYLARYWIRQFYESYQSDRDLDQEFYLVLKKLA